MSRNKTRRFLFWGIFLLFNGVAFSQPANLYTFFGDADLGVDYIGFSTAGLHYIGSRGDTVYVVWSKAHTYCQKSADGGQTFGSPVRVNSTPDGVNPSMKVDTGGMVYVAYQHNADIYISKSTDGGMTFTPGVKVNEDIVAGAQQGLPSIAVNNKGQIFIAWTGPSFNAGQPYSAAFASASFDSGRTFTPAVQINDSTTPMGGGIVDIAADNEHIYAAWLPYATQIRLSRSDDSGQTFYFKSFVNDLPSDSSFGAGGRPSLAIGGGLVSVAWKDFRNNRFSIRFSVSSDLGQIFPPSVVVDSNSHGMLEPSLFWRNGLFYVVWPGVDTLEGNPNFENHIYFSYSPDGGSSFVPFVGVVTVDTNLAYYNGGSISVNDQGKAFVVWADSRYDPWFQENWHLFVAVGAASSMKGDLNLGGMISPVDVVFELNAVFLGRTFPAPFQNADGNCDGRLSPADVALLLNATFLGNPFPC